MRSIILSFYPNLVLWFKNLKQFWLILSGRNINILQYAINFFFPLNILPLNEVEKRYVYSVVFVVEVRLTLICLMKVHRTWRLGSCDMFMKQPCQQVMEGSVWQINHCSQSERLIKLFDVGSWCAEVGYMGCCLPDKYCNVLCLPWPVYHSVVGYIEIFLVSILLIFLVSIPRCWKNSEKNMMLTSLIYFWVERIESVLITLKFPDPVLCVGCAD